MTTIKPNQIDFSVDLAYGLLLFLAIVLILTVDTMVGIAFGLGALVAYIIHVGWKMSRFDPEWMTREVTEKVGESITQEVTESVGEKVSEEVAEDVEEKVTEKVTHDVEAALSGEITDIIAQLEKVNERIEKRPSRAELDEVAEEAATKAAKEATGENNE